MNSGEVDDADTLNSYLIDVAQEMDTVGISEDIWGIVFQYAFIGEGVEVLYQPEEFFFAKRENQNVSRFDSILLGFLVGSPLFCYYDNAHNKSLNGIYAMLQVHMQLRLAMNFAMNSLQRYFNEYLDVALDDRRSGMYIPDDGFHHWPKCFFTPGGFFDQLYYLARAHLKDMKIRTFEEPMINVVAVMKYLPQSDSPYSYDGKKSFRNSWEYWKVVNMEKVDQLPYFQDPRNQTGHLWQDIIDPVYVGLYEPLFTSRHQDTRTIQMGAPGRIISLHNFFGPIIQPIIDPHADPFDATDNDDDEDVVVEDQGSVFISQHQMDVAEEFMTREEWLDNEDIETLLTVVQNEEDNDSDSSMMTRYPDPSDGENEDLISLD